MIYALNLPKVCEISSLRQSASKLSKKQPLCSTKINNYKKNFSGHDIKNTKPIIKRFKPII